MIVRPVGGRYSHAEACVFTYINIHDTVVYLRSLASVPSLVRTTNKSGLKYIILKSFRHFS